MEKIVCAIRGGDTSRRAQERAVVLGQERNGLVIFVHIIDTELIHAMDTPLTDAVQVEMEQTSSDADMPGEEISLRAEGIREEFYGTPGLVLEAQVLFDQQFPAMTDAVGEFCERLLQVLQVPVNIQMIGVGRGDHSNVRG